jgi:hypothetical protein
MADGLPPGPALPRRVEAPSFMGGKLGLSCRDYPIHLGRFNARIARMQKSRLLSLTRCVFTLSLTATVARGGVNVLTYHNDNSRTGDNLSETILTPANVNVNTFGLLFTYAVDGDVYAQPLHVSDLPIAGAGIRDVVFVATEHNSVYAFDADNNTGSSGGLLWHVNLGPSVATPNPDFGNRYGGFQEIAPEVGITGTPLIDLASQTLYVDAFTHEGSDYIHRIHALDIATGAERSYSPVVVRAAIPGNGVGGSNGTVVFDSDQQLQRSALTLASGILYVVYTGFADSNPYHGWILGFDSGNLRLSADHIFNSTPNSTIADFGTNAGESGIWMAGSGLAVDTGGNLYFSTGNGSFNAFNGSGGTEFGDTFLKLSTAHGLAVADYFTPYNQAYLATNDLDIGSGGVLLVPEQPGPVPYIVLGAGKPGVIYTINRETFTAANNHYNANGNSDAVLQTIGLNGGNFSTPAYFNGMVYFTPANVATAAFSISNGMLSLPPSSLGARTYPFPGATASVSANGQSDGIVWTVERANPATLVADDANDVSTEIYNSEQAGLRDQLPEGTKFAVPTIANGKVFVGGHLALSVFGLLPPTNEPIVGTYYGLFYGSNDVQIGQSGFLAVTVSAQGHYFARLQLAASPYSFTGQFDASGLATHSVKIARQSPLQVQLQFTGGDSPALTGTVGNGSWLAGITAYETAFNARTNPAPFAGNYTLVIHGPNDGNPEEPQGDGYGTVSISTSGLLKFKGTLADGTQVSQTTSISEDGQWPLYSSLYGGRGQIIGWVDFTNTAQSDLSGNLDWTKLKIASANRYAAGFDFAPALEGSHFIAGSAKAPVLDFSGGVLILTGDGIPNGLTNYFTIDPDQRLVSSNRLSLNFSPSSGLFTGTQPNPLPGRAPLSFRGVFLPKENYGAGYFIVSDLSGAVYFGPQ